MVRSLFQPNRDRIPICALNLMLLGRTFQWLPVVLAYALKFKISNLRSIEAVIKISILGLLLGKVIHLKITFIKLRLTLVCFVMPTMIAQLRLN